MMPEIISEEQETFFGVENCGGGDSAVRIFDDERGDDEDESSNAQDESRIDRPSQSSRAQRVQVQALQATLPTMTEVVRF